jgi:DNA-binding Xre family transcriptional regulator
VTRWRVREIAEPERWSARKLAQATGLAYNTVWAIWVNKSKRADLDTLKALARVLKVAPGDLIGASENQAQPAGAEGDQGESQLHSILELRGLGKELWQQTDSSDYLRQERAAWDG